MARPPSSSSVRRTRRMAASSGVDRPREHATVVHAGDLIGGGVSAQPDSRSPRWLHPALASGRRTELPACRTAGSVGGWGVWPVLRTVRTGEVLIVAALKRPVP